MPNNTRAHFFRVAPNKVNKIEAALRLDRIYLGWPATRGLLDSQLTKRQLKISVAEGYPHYSTYSLGIAVAHLWRFIREMPVGSYVIVPPKDRHRRLFYIGRIRSAARLYRGNDPDIALERSVEWLNGKEPFLRTEVSRSLDKLLKYRQTSLPVSDDAILHEIEALVGNGLWFPDDLDESRTYPQGAKKRVLVNAYERDRKARADCIRIYGAKCVVCGFDFQAQYGDLGRVIIHVHHLIPVSQLPEGYKVNPKTDLCPVCPNCHAIIHPTSSTTLTIKQAKRLVVHPFPW